MKKKTLLLAGIIMFAFALAANLQYAFSDYGISDGNLSTPVFASTGGTGGYPQKCSSCPPVQFGLCDTCDGNYFWDYCCREGALYICPGHSPC
jgi:hypothetical protein